MFIIEFFGLWVLLSAGVIIVGLLTTRRPKTLKDWQHSRHTRILQGWEHYGKNRSDLGERRKLW